MLIKHNKDRLEPTSLRFLFIELDLEDFRCKNSIYKRTIAIAKQAKGSRRANVIRILRSNLSDEDIRNLIYLDKVSTRYKQCLLRSKFNYSYRRFDSSYKSSKRFKAL